MDDKKLSRRNFLRTSGVGAAAVVASTVAANVFAQSQPGTAAATESVATPRPIIPLEFDAAKSAVFPEVTWPLNGGQVFAKICKAEGLAALFCCPGNYAVVHAIAEEGIPVVSCRDERSAGHAADAFSRATGEIAACSGTEGPGFTNLITAIATAKAARSPMLVLASNMQISQDDAEAQLQMSSPYQQVTTEGMKKYGKRIITPNRVAEYAAYAFRHLRNGEPMPVHLDFPSEVTSAMFESQGDLIRSWGVERYRANSLPYPDPRAVQAAVDMIDRAERPIIVASTGSFYSQAWEAIIRAAEKNDIAMVTSGPSSGHIPADHRLSADASPDALASADLVVFVGQYNMPPAGEPGSFAFGPDAKIIQIEPEAQKLGRNQPADVGIVSDERLAMEAIADLMPTRSRPAWVAELTAARQDFEDEMAGYYADYRGFNEAVHPAVIAHELADFLYRGDIPREQSTVVAGGYGIARYVRRMLRGYRPGQIINGAYHFGTIGPDLAYAVGVATAVRDGVGVQAPYKGAPIFNITGDAGFGFSGFELETMSKYQLPVINILYSNNAWGTWTGSASNPITLPIHLFQENLRYDKVAEGLGAHGEYVNSPDQFTPALKRAYDIAVKEGRPSLIVCQGKKEFWDRSQYAPGFLGKVEPGVMAYYH